MRCLIPGHLLSAQLIPSFHWASLRVNPTHSQPSLNPTPLPFTYKHECECEISICVHILAPYSLLFTYKREHEHHVFASHLYVSSYGHRSCTLPLPSLWIYPWVYPSRIATHLPVVSTCYGLDMGWRSGTHGFTHADLY